MPYWPAQTAPQASIGFRRPIVDKEDEELGARNSREHYRTGMSERKNIEEHARMSTGLIIAPTQLFSP